MLTTVSSVSDRWTNVEHWLNNTDPGNAQSLEKNLCQCPFVHHKSYTSWPGTGPGCPQWKACNNEMAPKQFHYIAVYFKSVFGTPVFASPPVFMHIHRIAKSNYILALSCLSVHLHGTLSSCWEDFHEIWYLKILWKSVKNIKYLSILTV